MLVVPMSCVKLNEKKNKCVVNTGTIEVYGKRKARSRLNMIKPSLQKEIKNKIKRIQIQIQI